MSDVKPNNKKYVIRGYQFGYNDECFYVEGNRIKSTFTNKKSAEKRYKSLEVKAAREFNLNEIEGLFDGDDKTRKACNTFVMETCGINIVDDKGYIEWGVKIPAEMSDDDVLKFVDIADMHSYQLLAFDVNEKFYALWMPNKKSYYLAPSEDMEHFVYEESTAEIMKIVSDIAEDTKWYPIKIKGSLEKISHSPLLLKKLIAQEKKIQYLEKKQILKLSGISKKSYIALNALLLKPLFEIKQLSLEDVMVIEKKLMKEYMRECGWEGDDDF